MADKVQIGQQLGNYQILSLLGSGGFAQVFLAEHVYLNTQAAIKVLSMQLGGDEIDVFLKEARTIARLVHPNIVRVLDFGVQSGIPFLVLDYAPNGSLRQVYPRSAQLPLPTIVSYVKQVADALQYAHDEKLIHRDVKPENMLLGRRNEVLLSDFGLALTSQSSRQGMEVLAGTAVYIAPEQIQGKPRPASDQYSLGIVVYEWLTGERPFQGTFSEVISQQLSAAPPPLREKLPELSPAIEQVVLRALAKDFTTRFASVSEFAAALEQAARTPGQANVFAAPLQGAMPPMPPVPLRELETDLRLPQPAAPASNVSPPGGQGLPVGAVICSYRGHAAPVRTLSWFPDGAKILSASAEKSIHIWDAMTGNNLRLYQDVSAAALLAGCSYDGRFVATVGSDAQVRVWDFMNNQLLSVYAGHTGAVINALAWSPTEPVLATAASDGSVHVWDATAGQRQQVIPAITIYRGHSASVSALAWSPNGESLISGSVDGFVQSWQARTGKTLTVYRSQSQGQAAPVLSVAWSSDALGSLLGLPQPGGKSGSRVACGRADGQIEMWEVASEREVLAYRYPAAVRVLCWSPDARRFSYGSDDATVLVWDTVTNLKLYTFSHTAPIQTLSWSPNGRYLASGGGDATIQVWVAP